MQNSLLTIASAIILVIAAAFAAPFLVDWTQFRGAIEQQATRMVGMPVTIGGAIDVEFLPVPGLRLQQVSIGAPGSTNFLSVGELRGDFSLGDLMRGHIRAESLALRRPSLTLDLDTLRRMAGETGGTAFSINALTIEDGTLDLTDTAIGQTLRMSQADLSGSLGGLRGPLRLDGDIDAGGHRRRVKLALSGLEADASTRLRASVQSLAAPFTLEVDGTLRLAGAAPAFDGKASVSVLTQETSGLRGVAADSGAASGWSLSATVAATPSLIEARELGLKLGAGERPVELSGQARFIDPLDGEGRSRLELALAARQLDLGVATGAASPLATLNAVAGTLAPLSRLAATGLVGLSSETVLVSGAAMREVKAELEWNPDGWSARTLEARLPGRASIRLSGAFPAPVAEEKRDLFVGTIDLSTEELAAFIGWALPEAPAAVVGLPTGETRLQGDIVLREDAVSFSRATLAVGTMTLEGDAAYTFARGARGSFRADLTAEGVDLDPLLVPVRRLLAMGGEKLDVSVGFTGRQVRLAGADAGQIDLAVTTTPEGLSIQRLALERFGGLNVTGSGLLVAPAEGAAPGADGRFEARLVGARVDGLPALARTFGLVQAEDLITRLGPTLAPVDISLSLAAERGRLMLDAHGRLGMLDGVVKTAFGGGQASAGTVGITVEDAGVVFSRLGFSMLAPRLGPARLDVDIGRDIDVALLVAGAQLEAKGALSWDEAGLVQPDLSLKLSGADLARLLPALAQGGVGSLPATLQGALSRDGQDWRVEGLTGTVAGRKVDGRFAYLPAAPQPFDADFTLAEWDVPTALALVSGFPAPGHAGPWPDGRFGRPALADLRASVRLEVGRFDLPAGLALDNARLRLRLAEGGMTVEEIAGSLAGGRLAGRFTLGRRGDLAQMEGHLSLSDADAEILLRAAGAVRPGMRARVGVTLDMAGSGGSPRAMAALSGQGSLALSGLELAGTDPAALAFVMRATEAGAPPDEARMIKLMEEGLARGVLRLGQGESPLSLVDGIVRTGSMRFSQGAQRFALSGSLDVPQLAFEAALEMEDPSIGSSAAMPGVILQWRGPLSGPERRIDVTALSAAINMRALERETRRLEEEFRRRPPPSQAPAERTPSAPADPVIGAPVPPRPAPVPFTMKPRDVAPSPAARPKPAPLRPGEVRSQPLPPPLLLQSPAPRPEGATRTGGAAPPLPPPINIAPDVLRSPIMAPPLAP